MICGLFWCIIWNNVKFVVIYLFSLHQHTAPSNITSQQHSVSSPQHVINIVLVYIITIYTCVSSFSAIVHWFTKMLVFLSCCISNYRRNILFSKIYNLLLCDIFGLNYLLQTSKSTTFQFSIICNVVLPLKYRALS